MTFLYFPLFDMRRITPGTLDVATTGESPIQLSLSSLTQANQFETQTSVFNYMVSSTEPMLGLDRQRSQFMPGVSKYTFGGAVALALRELAADAGWSFPDDIQVNFSDVDRWFTFTYSQGFTTLSWSSSDGRRLFGFSSNYSGASQTTLVGDEPARYVLAATLDGPLSITPITEDDPLALFAYSGGGRSYAVARNAFVLRKRWVQQFEPKAKTFRRFAAGTPDEYTFQQLFEDCGAGLPFGAGDVYNDYLTAYAFDDNSECFRPLAATPGNADQFHIPFNAIVLGTTE